MRDEDGTGLVGSDRKLRVLIVDDNTDASELLALLLQERGHEVRAVSDGPTALGLVADFRPQVVVLDLRMPVMNGYEVARRLRERPDCARVPMIALSGFSHEGARKQALDTGFDHYIIKGGDLEEVIRTLEAIP